MGVVSWVVHGPGRVSGFGSFVGDWKPGDRSGPFEKSGGVPCPVPVSVSVHLPGRRSGARFPRDPARPFAGSWAAGVPSGVIQSRGPLARSGGVHDSPGRFHGRGRSGVPISPEASKHAHRGPFPAILGRFAVFPYIRPFFRPGPNTAYFRPFCGGFEIILNTRVPVRREPSIEPEKLLTNK